MEKYICKVQRKFPFDKKNILLLPVLCVCSKMSVIEFKIVNDHRRDTFPEKMPPPLGHSGKRLFLSLIQFMFSLYRGNINNK